MVMMIINIFNIITLDVQIAQKVENSGVLLEYLSVNSSKMASKTIRMVPLVQRERTPPTSIQ